LCKRACACYATPPRFNDADLIVVSNNYWITDTRPCLTYGMRGSINMEVCTDAAAVN
jgi:hypothetical protein